MWRNRWARSPYKRWGFADFSKGMLNITLPKTPEAQKQQETSR